VRKKLRVAAFARATAVKAGHTCPPKLSLTTVALAKVVAKEESSGEDRCYYAKLNGENAQRNLVKRRRQIRILPV
jgi:hypothetical protein